MFARGLWARNASLVVGISKNQKKSGFVEKAELQMDWTTMAPTLGNFDNELFCISSFRPCFLC
jgi:hypothetical protein